MNAKCQALISGHLIVNFQSFGQSMLPSPKFNLKSLYEKISPIVLKFDQYPYVSFLLVEPCKIPICHLNFFNHMILMYQKVSATMH